MLDRSRRDAGWRQTSRAACPPGGTWSRGAWGECTPRPVRPGSAPPAPTARNAAGWVPPGSDTGLVAERWLPGLRRPPELLDGCTLSPNPYPRRRDSHVWLFRNLYPFRASELEIPESWFRFLCQSLICLDILLTAGRILKNNNSDNNNRCRSLGRHSVRSRAICVDGEGSILANSFETLSAPRSWTCFRVF